MAKKPLRIADALGFGSSAKPYVSPYLREVSKIKRGDKLPGTITRAPRPSAATELAQLLTPNTRFGNELAAKIAPAVEMSPLGVLTGLVDARRSYQEGNVGNAASTGILAALGAVPGGKAATLFDTVRDAGMGQVFRRTPEGAYITVMENSKYAPRPNSVTDFVVPEELRGKGIGGKMLDEIFGIYGPETISAAASSVPSVKAFYKRGLRPGGNPNATLDDAIKIMKEDSSVTMVKPLPPTADEYIKAINPTGTRIPSSERPNLGMGDMYGMLPKEAQKVAEKEYPQFGKVKYMSSNGDVYAVGFNPDVGEEDVLGYAMSRGDGTELALANELQGLGIGSDLSYLYRSKNPFAPSGGLTEAGEKAARKAYKRMMGNE